MKDSGESSVSHLGQIFVQKNSAVAPTLEVDEAKDHLKENMFFSTDFSRKRRDRPLRADSIAVDTCSTGRKTSEEEHGAKVVWPRHEGCPNLQMLTWNGSTKIVLSHLGTFFPTCV